MNRNYNLHVVLSAIVVCALVVASPAQAALIGYYNFDNLTANDTSGYGNNATIGVDASAGLSGTNSGCVRMFAPNPLQSGSSVSHFTSDAFPNLLMEPALNTSIFNKVDLTLPLFQDIDWNTQPEDILFIDGFDPSPCSFVQP